MTTRDRLDFEAYQENLATMEKLQAEIDRLEASMSGRVRRIGGSELFGARSVS
jgi:hypothetical protein